MTDTVYRVLAEKIDALEEELREYDEDLEELAAKLSHAIFDVTTLIDAFIRISEGACDPVGIAHDALDKMTCAGAARRGLGI